MDGEPEIIEAELVELRSVELDRPRRIAPAAQAAAAAAGGFLAGAATVALAHRLGARRISRLPEPLRPGASLSRPAGPFRENGTYLVSVRMVNRPPL